MDRGQEIILLKGQGYLKHKRLNDQIYDGKEAHARMRDIFNHALKMICENLIKPLYKNEVINNLASKLS